MTQTDLHGYNLQNFHDKIQSTTTANGNNGGYKTQFGLCQMPILAPLAPDSSAVCE